jgi:hypothetical protein
MRHVWGMGVDHRNEAPWVELPTPHIARLIFGNVCMFKRNSSAKVFEPKIMSTIEIWIANSISPPTQLWDIGSSHLLLL